jgi:hypothetical protein
MSGPARASPVAATPVAALATAVVAGVAILGVLVLVAAPFFTATTFVGDDHVFLAFARFAPNPLVAFVRDQHGGEFYRPLPMLAWWLLGRAGAGAAWPFAALAFALHAAAAALLGALVVGLGRPRAVAALAAALFFLAPQNLEAAYWYAASTDLFATAFTLAALVALVRRSGSLASGALALCAYLSKESALVLPALAFIVLGATATPEPRARRLRIVLPHVLLAAVVLVVRVCVLRGWGGSGDERATLAGKLVQLASGLVHVATGSAALPGALAWGLGTMFLALIVYAAARRARASGRSHGGPGLRPLAFTALTLSPLLGPGWIVGARYFYLPAVGLCWAAAEGLADSSFALGVTVCAALLGPGALQAGARRHDVVSYEARLAAARRAVVDGARQGSRVFHVDGGIKDLDLAVKEDPALAPLADELLVLGDVPASFTLVPPALAGRAAMLVAAPPLPPSGAYRFGARRIVGLARRGDDPTLAEVIARFPDIRFIRLRPTPGAHVIARDVTDEVKAASD